MKKKIIEFERKAMYCISGEKYHTENKVGDMLY